MDSGLIEVFNNPLIWSLLAMVAANFVLAVLAAFIKGTFELAKLADIAKRIVIYVIPVLVLYGLAYYADGFWPVATALYSVVMAALTAHILAALGELGLPIPEDILSKIKKIP